MINVLTRVSRPQLFERLKASIDHPVNLIIHNDIAQRERVPYDWNLFCNDLKARVDCGYYLYCDDDETFVPGALKKLDELLSFMPDGLIVQFLRNGRPKPSDNFIRNRIIKYGCIGGGSLVLHSKFKNIANWQSKRGADFYYIKEISEKVILHFVSLVLQETHNNGLIGKIV